MQGRTHQVSRDGRAHRDARGLAVANFADGNDIGVLTQNRAQAVCKRHAGLFVDLALVHAGDVVLDRVLERDDIDFLAREVLEHRAHRGRFAAARRADKQDDAARILE